MSRKGVVAAEARTSQEVLSAASPLQEQDSGAGIGDKACRGRTAAALHTLAPCSAFSTCVRHPDMNSILESLPDPFLNLSPAAARKGRAWRGSFCEVRGTSTCVQLFFC